MFCLQFSCIGKMGIDRLGANLDPRFVPFFCRASMCARFLFFWDRILGRFCFLCFAVEGDAFYPRKEEDDHYLCCDALSRCRGVLSDFVYKNSVCVYKRDHFV